MTTQDGAPARVDSNMDAMVSALQGLVRQPSVSATGEGILECARMVRDALEGCGMQSEILELEGGAAPVVYGEVRSKANPAKTILFYNHYDVQPAGDVELWDDPPFAGVVKDGKVFGRGAADDKGELVTRAWAVRAWSASCTAAVPARCSPFVPTWTPCRFPIGSRYPTPRKSRT